MFRTGGALNFIDLVIIDGDSGLFLPDERPHESLRAAIWDKGPGIPNYLYFAGMLWQMGVRANVRVVYHQRTYQGATPGEIAAQLTPAAAKPDEIDQFATGIAPLLAQAEGGYHYHSKSPVGMMIWSKS